MLVYTWPRLNSDIYRLQCFLIGPTELADTYTFAWSTCIDIDTNTARTAVSWCPTTKSGQQSIVNAAPNFWACSISVIARSHVISVTVINGLHDVSELHIEPTAMLYGIAKKCPSSWDFVHSHHVAVTAWESLWVTKLLATRIYKM